MIRFVTMAIIFASLAAGSALPVLAQSQQAYRGTPAQQAACRPNVFRFCAEEIPDVHKITACLRRNITRLTPDCAAVFADEQH